MICDNCNIDREDSDFIKSQKFCYRCEYQKKVEKTPKKKIKKLGPCRVCGGKIPVQEILTQQQRSVFCSAQCADMGHREFTKNYWTHYLRKRKVNAF